jgi:glutamyl-tRNA synthetase
MGWPGPQFAHVPLIHGPDGAKLSKRHGALGVDAYRDMGYLAEALRNYLLRLGWAHGDEEIISTGQAVEWFGLDGVGRSPSRFDAARLENLNGHYIRQAGDKHLLGLMLPHLEKSLGKAIDDKGRRRLTAGMDGLKQRAKTLAELADNALFYVRRPVFPLDNAKAAGLLAGEAPALLREVATSAASVSEWSAESLEHAVKKLAGEKGLGLGKLAQPARAALTGSNVSPGIFEVMEVLGREETEIRFSMVPDNDRRD